MTNSSTNHHTPYDRKQAIIFLLTRLQATLNEQHKARLISKESTDYIYVAVKDQARYC